jgi:hypothetical protein
MGVQKSTPRSVWYNIREESYIKWFKFQFVYVILNGQNFLDSIEDYCPTKLSYNKSH